MPWRLALAALAVVTIAAVPANAQMPPQPGPEHEVLKLEAGTWDAALEMAAPDGTTMKATGVQVDTVACGGLCLLTEMKADMMGMVFNGHGITTWDAVRKKYVGSWSDSMSAGMALSEGDYDSASKTMTSWMEARDMMGALTKNRAVSQFADADHKSMTMFTKGPDGKDVQAMKITYTRRK